MDINVIYKKERIINKYFKEQYDYNSSEIFNKQVLELLCELSEFAYETKCFKYWKNESQSPKEITIPEFADALMITLCFCDLANIDKIEITEIKEKDMVKLFIDANSIAASLNKDLEKEKLFKILSILIAISKLLGYSDSELMEYCLLKMNRTLKRVSSKENVDL